MIELTLPYPPKELSPNKRLHWARVAKVKAAYRCECWADARAALIAHYGRLPGAKDDPLLPRPLPITFEFCPPDRRRRDRDNAIAALKAGADGLADAIGIDDAEWNPTYTLGEPVKGGAVRVRIEEA